MNVGSVPLKMRLRIDAGVNDSEFFEVGHAETTIHMPVTVTTTETGMVLAVDNDSFAETCQAIVDAASNVIKERYGILGAFDEPTKYDNGGTLSAGPSKVDPETVNPERPEPHLHHEAAPVALPLVYRRGMGLPPYEG